MLTSEPQGTSGISRFFFARAALKATESKDKVGVPHLLGPTRPQSLQGPQHEVPQQALPPEILPPEARAGAMFVSLSLRKHAGGQQQKGGGPVSLCSRNSLPGDLGVGLWVPQRCDSWLGASHLCRNPGLLQGSLGATALFAQNKAPLKSKPLPHFPLFIYPGGMQGGGTPPSVIPWGC